MGDESVIDKLIRQARDPASSSESLREAVGSIIARLSSDDRRGAEAALRRLAEEVIDTPTRADVAGAVALCCGALVERGFDHMIALGSILDRLERQVAPDAITFVDACRQAAEAEPPPPPDEGDEPDEGGNEPPSDPVEREGARIAASMPTAAQAFHALEPFSLAAIAMLSRSVEARKASWSRTSLRASLDALGGQYGHAGLLWMMMKVLDDEPIMVLHPEERKGYRVRISGLADNFQLHTLLADALIGWFSSRWLRGRRPSRAEVAAARDAPSCEGGPSARGAFNLWTWRGLQPDGTLSAAMSGSDQWIWNEGVPADIPSFEGTRIVLLGPPPYARSWNSGRRFPDMVGDLRLEYILTSGEVNNLLGRIVAASAAT
jgi:hypothetical protein